MKILHYSFQSGQLHVDGRTYPRPCDWVVDCDPCTFLGGARTWTPAAQAALALTTSRVCPLRGLPNDFLVFTVGLEGSVPTVCGLACVATTLTVRFEDVWQLLPPNRRALSYTCAVTRDPHAKDSLFAQAEGVVHESLSGLAPDVRICLDLADGGGFVLSFQPEP